MRSALLGIAVAYFVVATVEITFHWYAATQDSETALHLKDVYLRKDPQNGKAYIAGLIDIVLPAIFFGIVAGGIGGRWRFRNLGSPRKPLIVV